MKQKRTSTTDIERTNVNAIRSREHTALNNARAWSPKEKNRPVIDVVPIPSFIFKDRNIAVLECLVEYLHERHKLTFHEIAQLINRNDRTIWTVYHRAKQKRTTMLRL